MKGACALCKQTKTLEVSHIVPAFFYRYLKATSATGFLRAAEDPNKRVQDGFKKRLLCRDCENIFSKYERSFASNYFPTLQADNFLELQYGSDLYKFAISIVWRVLMVSLEDIEREHPEWMKAALDTLEQWRHFLLASRKSNDTAVHMFVFAGAPAAMSRTVHPKTLYYLLRAVDVTMYHGRKVFGVYAKLIRTTIFVPIFPKHISGMVNTRVHIGGGRILSPQVISNPYIGGFIANRPALAFRSAPSADQLAKMEALLTKEPQRAVMSESFEVFRANRRLGLEDKN